MLELPYHAVLWLAGAVSAPLAVVLVTLAVRAALLPLAVRAARGEGARMAALARMKTQPDQPELRVLAGGLVPVLLQMPCFMVLYRLFNASTVDGTGNALLQHTLLGVHLGTRFHAAPGALVFWAVFAALALIAWYAGRSAAGIGKLLPYTTVLFAAYVPLAAGLYLVTSTAWTAVERRVLKATITGAESG